MGPAGPRKVSPVSFEDWTFWYHNNKDDIENLKAALYALHASGSEIFRSGGRDEGARTSATRLTEKKVQELIIPTLLKLMDPKVAGGQDTESAAYLALAKIAKDPEQIKTIQTGLDLALDRQPVVQESAALALGLLRRADPADQFSARELDKVREFLFTVFENDKYRDRCRGSLRRSFPGTLATLPPPAASIPTHRLNCRTRNSGRSEESARVDWLAPRPRGIGHETQSSTARHSCCRRRTRRHAAHRACRGRGGAFTHYRRLPRPVFADGAHQQRRRRKRLSQAAFRSPRSL